MLISSDENDVLQHDLMSNGSKILPEVLLIHFLIEKSINSFQINFLESTQIATSSTLDAYFEKMLF
jgi:hypothetical protein